MIAERYWPNADQTAQWHAWASLSLREWGFGVVGSWYRGDRGLSLCLGPFELGLTWGWLY